VTTQKKQFFRIAIFVWQREKSVIRDMRERACRETSASISRRALSAKICGATDKNLEAFQVRELEIGRNISKLVAEHELNRLHRRETLYKKWDENVFIPTAKSINKKEMESKLAKFARSKSVCYEAYLDHVNLRQRQHEKNTVFLNVHTPDYDALSCQVQRIFNRPHQHFLAKSPFRKNEDNHEPNTSSGYSRSGRSKISEAKSLKTAIKASS